MCPSFQKENMTEKEDSVQKVYHILQRKDGKPFEEKKKEAEDYIRTLEEPRLAEIILERAVQDETGKKLKKQFWETGEIKKRKSSISLRDVKETDRESFLALQRESNIVKVWLNLESYQKILWEEHIREKSIMLSIEVDHEYAGYCGINDSSSGNWEIAIELLKKFQRQGMGTAAIQILIEEMKNRLDVKKFLVKIDPDNIGSQKLFEKLGAKPHGIANGLLKKEEDKEQFEMENEGLIDERLTQLAEKFGVEPKKLLSHVLVYQLEIA